MENSNVQECGCCSAKNVNRRLAMYFFWLILMVFLASAIYLFAGKKDLIINQPVTKTLKFSYTLTNTSADFIAEAEFLSFLPLVLPGSQVITSLDASQDYEILDHDSNQHSIKFVIHNLPPYGSKVINLAIEVEVSALPQVQAIKKALYLKEEKYIEITSTPVQSIVQSLPRAEEPTKIIYEWLANNINDAGYVAENKGAKFALEKRLGDCTEHMYAFIALARAKGIPARGVAGFVVDNSAAVLASASYHNWAEFHDGKKWILVDPQRKIYDDKYQHYLPFRHFGGDPAAGELSTNRFLATDQRISIHL